MPLRTLTATITLSDGSPFTGTLRVTPLEEIFTDGGNIAIKAVDHAVTAGELAASTRITVPGCYGFALLDGAGELQCFEAYVPDGSGPVSLYDLAVNTYLEPAARAGVLFLAQGSSIMLLAPGAGLPGQYLQRIDSATMAWSDPPAAGWEDITGKPSAFPPLSHAHTDATGTTAGFMSPADKQKLDALDVVPPLPAPIPYFFSTGSIGFNITNMHVSAAPLEFNNASGVGEGRMVIDLTNATSLRLAVSVSDTTEPTSCVATAQYSTDGGATWSYFHAVALNVPLNTPGGKLTGWAALPAVAKGDVLVRIVGHGGGSGSTATVVMVRLDVR